MRIVKWLGIAVGALAGLFVLVAVLVALFFDPNDYKDDIERLAAQQTGRELTLDGDLELSLFPWIAIEFGPARLSEAPGFGDQPFVELEHARLSVRLLPLLGGKVEIGTVTLDGLQVRLITDAEGRNNWADLAATDAESAPTGTEPPQELPTIAGLQVRNSLLSMEDRRDNSVMTVRELEVDMGALESGEPFDFATGFLLELSSGLSARTAIEAGITADFERNVHGLAGLEVSATLLGPDYPAEGIPLALQAASATVDAANERHSLEGLVVEVTWHGEGLPAAGVPLTLAATQLKADLAAQTLALAGLDMNAAGATITGSLTGEEILDAPRLAGALVLAPVNLREWLPAVGVELPVTRDPEVLKSLAFRSNVALTSTSVNLADLEMKLDDTTATGTFGVADLDSRALRFDLEVDRIDADRYLAPDPEGEAPAAESDEPFEIPVEMLRTLNARGTLAIREAVFAGIKFTALKLGVTARDGDVRLNPVEASAYGGQYRGDVAIAAASDAAKVTLDQRVSNIDFTPLFKDLFESERLSGKGNFNSKLTATGRDSRALVRTLDGTVDFTVNDGAIEGADLWYEIRRARAVLARQAIPAREGAARTAFTEMKGSATVREGVVESKDLAMAMQYLRVGGQARIDLPKNEIDSRLETTVLRIPAEGADTAGMGDMVNARIPVVITGSLNDPTVRPDVEGYLKSKVGERIEQEKEKVEEKIRDTIQDRLRRAIGGQ